SASQPGAGTRRQAGRRNLPRNRQTLRPITSIAGAAVRPRFAPGPALLRGCAVRCFCRSGRSAAIRAASGAPAGSGGFFLADVEGLVDAGDDFALFVDNLHRPLRQVLVTVGGSVANLVQHLVSEGKGGTHRARARLDEIDMRRLVPDDVVAP